VPTTRTTSAAARIIALAALAIAGVALAVAILNTGSAYTIHARFVDAGQLVKGNLVEVSGRPVGKVTDIRLTDDNQADIVMKITDDEFRPLREGTTATVRQVGLSGVANRFVELTPGRSSSPALHDGATLSTDRTRPIVDLDEVLNALDPRTRANLQTVIRQSEVSLSGASQDANAALRYLNPALSQTAQFAEELGRDDVALRQLVKSTATVSAAVASRQSDLEQGVTNTSVALRALASERAALEDVLARSPGVLHRSVPTLRRLRSTLAALRPTLRAAQPAARPLARVLSAVPPAAWHSAPIVRELRALLPDLRRTLEGMPALANELVPNIEKTTATARPFLPVLAGLRPYVPDLIAGLYNGFGGVTSGYYDANGHYGRIQANVGAGGVAGLGSLFNFTVPALTNYRTGLDARCPGAAAAPAPDGSNPWTDDPSLCDPGDNPQP
jgi:phospholipid/cholesterol/gamma-HCH transport system substrate-binding protein